MISIKWIQEKISGVFYHHGLFCASHPFAIITTVIVIACFLCYPLLNLPLPGNAPVEYTTPLDQYSGPPLSTEATSEDRGALAPRWYFGAPVSYIQQVVVKATVSPWDYKSLIQIDAFRAPLHKVFEVLEHIENFQYKDGDDVYTIGDLCLHIPETLREKGLKGLMPEYTCLITSPANFWTKDRARFQADDEIVKTVYHKYNQGVDSPPSLRDVLFGVPWKDTGISRIYFRTRQRVITYAITIAYKRYNKKFVRALQEHLHHVYPQSGATNSSQTQTVMHYHYRDINYIVEYTPLLVAYIVLFLYLYFSVRKIEMVKSKWGLALSAVVSVIASLLISVAVCLTFGLTPSLNGSEIFPYLVVIIGLENVLVVTKSVVSTPHHLDVKYRVAQGLSKEGWYIFKNLMTELFIVIVGFFTFVPAIQEFCMFALVGLWTDFFLQMFFFTTVLSIDIRRMELSDLQHHPLHPSATSTEDKTPASPKPSTPGICPVMTHLTLNPYTPHAYPTTIFPPPAGALGVESSDDPRIWGWRTDRTPRRVKLLNFWASTRMVQRALMICVVVWISILVYKTGLVEHLAHLNATLEELPPHPLHTPNSLEKDPHLTWAPEHDIMEGDVVGIGPRRSEAEDDESTADSGTLLQNQLSHDEQLWEKLSHNHWPALLGAYNISLSGKYISILPTIPVSVVISPQDAISLRHAKETQAATVLAGHRHWAQRAANPQGKFDLALSCLLVLASAVLLTYILMVLWKCLCPRRYHKWRPNWGRRTKHRKGSMYYKQIRESVPLLLQGHNQTIDCIATDGPWIISSCLGGHIRVWDSKTGEGMTLIERNWVSTPVQMDREPIAGRNISDSDADLYAEFHGDFSNSTNFSDLSYEGNDEYLSLHGSDLDLSGSCSGPGSSRSSRSSSFVQSPPSGSTPPTTKARHRAKHTRHKSADIYMADFAPDLSETINTNFIEIASDSRTGSRKQSENESEDQDVELETRSSHSNEGFDFSRHFREHFSQHWDSVEDRKKYEATKQQKIHEQRLWQKLKHEDLARKRSYSLSDNLNSVGLPQDGSSAPSVWCLDCRDNLIVVGCGNGRIEFWDGMTGQLKCMYHGCHDPVTALCFTGNKVICARLTGSIDFLELETFVNFNSTPTCNIPSPKLLHRGAFSSPILGSSSDMKSWDDIIHCTLLYTAHGHQQPINLLKYAGGRVVTGSQDHTLKVYRLEDSTCLYTLHGHHGGITALHLDKVAPLAAASGAEDGSVRMWDLLTGACVHKLAGHTEAVTSLTCTVEYIISSGIDDRLCVWERCKGQLLHWIQMEPGVCNCLGMLTSNLMITGGQGCLYLWDITKGDVLRAVSLGDSDSSVFIHQLLIIDNSIVVSDYDCELRVVHFPSVLEKTE